MAGTEARATHTASSGAIVTAEPPPLALMVSELMFSAWETMIRRAALIAQGECSPIEYRRMMLEKTRAACHSGLAIALLDWNCDLAAVIAPWHSRATLNARRLRGRAQQSADC
jgi:hypothetical protein